MSAESMNSDICPLRKPITSVIKVAYQPVQMAIWAERSKQKHERGSYGYRKPLMLRKMAT